MSCIQCPRSGALVCALDHCGICYNEGVEDPELVDYGKPSERSMEYMAALLPEEKS